MKGNQKELFEQIESRFNYQNPEMINEIIEKGHGRIETRKCEIITNLEHLDNRDLQASRDYHKSEIKSFRQREKELIEELKKN